MSIRRKTVTLSSILLLSHLCACGIAFKPSQNFNQLTQPPATYTAAGALAGAGVGALAAGTSHAAPMVIGALVGGGIGYYYGSLRSASSDILAAGGQVYSQGDRLAIAVPTYQVFETNTDRLLPTASTVLESVVTVLKRYPDDNIIISGNTNGFGLSPTQRTLSTNQAKQVSGYLWAHGINSHIENVNNEQENRQLIYVGYADRFPIANTITAEGIESNYRIQITAYPSAELLHRDLKNKFDNIGATDDASNILPQQPTPPSINQDVVPQDANSLPATPEVMNTLNDQFHEQDKEAAKAQETTPPSTIRNDKASP